jgi:LPXTG-motif cell wall-anchored protein
MPDTSSIIVRVVAGVLALVVLGIIIYRRKQKAKK